MNYAFFICKNDEEQEEIIEDIVENNETTETIAQESICVDDLEFGSAINYDPDDIEDHIPLIHVAD